MLSFDFTNRHEVFINYNLLPIINGFKDTEGLNKIASDLEALHEKMEQQE